MEQRAGGGLEVRGVTVEYPRAGERRRRVRRRDGGRRPVREAFDARAAEPVGGVCGTPAAAGVHDASMDVSRGEIVALLGPSGCGKSTVLRAIAGLEPVLTGTIGWDGNDLRGVPPHLRGFGLMFQDAQLFSHLTVERNVAYGLKMQGVPAVEREQRVAELLELVGLPGIEGRAVTELSGGERQRVALARSLAPRPRLLMLDEPLSALDRELRDRLALDLARVLRSTGTTAILVTHDESEAMTIADRIVRMRAGRIVAEARPDA